MELSQEEKDRIREEEKLRMEIRRDYLDRCSPGGHGCRRGWSPFRTLFIILGLFALFHLWHRPYCGWGPGYDGHPTAQTPGAAPVTPSPAPSEK